MDNSFRIVEDQGQGGFLCPPGHPRLRYTLKGGTNQNPSHTLASLDYALEPYAASFIPQRVIDKARKLLDEAVLIRSELWERHVYGYFRNSWSPDGIERDASKLHTGTGWHRGDDGEPVFDRDPRTHAAFLLVRKHFPDAEPREDLIVSGGDYGSRNCSTCGASVQYEPRTDDFRIFGLEDSPNHGLCTDGKPHTAPIKPSHTSTEETP